MKKQSLPRRRMDPNLVSNQPWEISYIAKKFGLSCKKVRAIKKKVKSRSRQKLYNVIRTIIAE